jgi:hypothetical protein
VGRLAPRSRAEVHDLVSGPGVDDVAADDGREVLHLRKSILLIDFGSNLLTESSLIFCLLLPRSFPDLIYLQVHSMKPSSGVQTDVDRGHVKMYLDELQEICA